MVVKVTEKNFRETVLENKLPVIVNFGADWCSACDIIEPIFEELADEFNNKAVFATIDAENEINLAMHFHIMTIPTILSVKNGEVIDKKVGFMTKENIVNMLSK